MKEPTHQGPKLSSTNLQSSVLLNLPIDMEILHFPFCSCCISCGYLQRILWSLTERYNVILKGLSHEIFRPVFWPVWIYLGLNGKCFSFLNFKEGSLILDNYFKYWCISSQTFSEIRRISEKDWQLRSRFSNFSLFWVSGPSRNTAKGVNTVQRFVESPRTIDNLFRGSPRMFFNNIIMSLIQLSILGNS